MGSIHREYGFVGGFFCGMVPAVIKGAVTNCIRFLGYGVITRTIRQGDEELTPAQTMLAGGVAGAVSAVLSQVIKPLDYVLPQIAAGSFPAGNVYWQATLRVYF